MSLSVPFNGVQLVKPGAASRVVSRLQNTTLAGANTLAVIGVANGGPPGLSVFTSAEYMRSTYRSGDLADAAGIAFNASNDERITGSPMMVYAYRVTNSGTPPTQSTLPLKNGSATTLVTLTARDYGLHTNKLTAVYSATNVLTITFNDGLNSTAEVSPAFSGARLSLAYTGGGSNPTYTVSGTQFSTSVAGGGSSDPLSLDFATFTTIGDLAAMIAANGAYSVAVTGSSEAPSDSLDRVTGAALSVSINTPTEITGEVQDVIDWVNTNSALASAAREVTGAVTGVFATTVLSAFSGAVAGTTPAQSDWDAGFTAMQSKRIHALVPLLDADGHGATFAATANTALAYGTAMSGTGGRNEVQVYMGMAASKTSVLAMARQTLNSPHVTLGFQRHTESGADGVLKSFPAWSSALLAASMRCCASLGEPLTFKYVRSFGLTQDASFNISQDMTQLLLAGVLVYEVVPSKGTRIVKGNTTFTRKDDDAYTEESVVFTWKALSYDFRTYLEDIFTGVKGSQASFLSMYDMAAAKLEQYRKSEVIVDSQDENGSPLYAWRDLTITADKDTAIVNVTVTIVEGINFQLDTIYLAPLHMTV